MLNDQDRMKVLLLKTLVEKERRDLPREDVLWALTHLERGAYSRPDDFSFPEIAALVNPIACNGFTMRSIGKPDWKWETQASEGALSRGVQAFGITAECLPVNAFLIVRPWIRAHADTTNKAFEQLRSCTVDLSVRKGDDFAQLLHQAPIDDYLIAQDGIGVRSLSPILKDRAPAFAACGLSMGPPGPYDGWMTPLQQIDPKKAFGIFCSGGSTISLDIQGSKDLKSDPMTVIAGLTVMEYSTKS